jgi:hypothetical protein
MTSPRPIPKQMPHSDPLLPHAFLSNQTEQRGVHTAMDTPPLSPAAPAPATFPRDVYGPVIRWFERNFVELGHEVRLSYLPPWSRARCAIP